LEVVVDRYFAGPFVSLTAKWNTQFKNTFLTRYLIFPGFVSRLQSSRARRRPSARPLSPQFTSDSLALLHRRVPLDMTANGPFDFSARTPDRLTIHSSTPNFALPRTCVLEAAPSAALTGKTIPCHRSNCQHRPLIQGNMSWAQPPATSQACTKDSKFAAFSSRTCSGTPTWYGCLSECSKRRVKRLRGSRCRRLPLEWRRAHRKREADRDTRRPAVGALRGRKGVVRHADPIRIEAAGRAPCSSVRRRAATPRGESDGPPKTGDRASVDPHRGSS